MLRSKLFVALVTHHESLKNLRLSKPSENQTTRQNVIVEVSSKRATLFLHVFSLFSFNSSKSGPNLVRSTSFRICSSTWPGLNLEKD